jgi:hypothetical protein
MHPAAPFRAAAAAFLLAGLLAGAPPAAAQTVTVPENAQRAADLSERIAFSLFVLTNTGFSAGGYGSYDDGSTAADFTIYSLPLRERFQTGLGPIELRLTLSGGTAVTNQLVALGPPGAIAADRSLQTTWNGRIDIGRPIELLPGLEFTPLVGLGYAAWTGKITRGQGGSVAIPSTRIDLWADSLVYELTGILEYTHRWRRLAFKPGISINYAYIDSFQGRANLSQPGAEAGRAKVGINGASTLVRSALRVEGPLDYRLLGLDLYWQGFVAGAYEVSQNSLFPWAVEVGAALGADFGPAGRRIGLDPGKMFLGASYVVGENLQGFRVNFGYRF